MWRYNQDEAISQPEAINKAKEQDKAKIVDRMSMNTPKKKIMQKRKPP